MRLNFFSSYLQYNKTMAALRRRRPKFKNEIEKMDQNDRKNYVEIAVNLEAPKLGKLAQFFITT